MPGRSRANLKNACARRSLAREFLSKGAPVVVLGVHLCGTLSLRAVSLFNEAPSCIELALKPCCLPPKLHATRNEVFELGAHAFRACEVCADGGWRKGRWIGSSNKTEVERKFQRWAKHLWAGVAADEDTGGRKVLSDIRVQATWWQNAFIFGRRPFVNAAPVGSLAESPEEREAAAGASKERVTCFIEEEKRTKAARQKVRNGQSDVWSAPKFAIMAAVGAVAMAVVAVTVGLARSKRLGAK